MKELESYLVKLGFSVDQSSHAKFQGAIDGTAKQVKSLVGNPTSGLIGDLLKLQFAFTGVFAALGAAFVGFVDKMGATNQEMRLGAMHALMSQEAYTKMNTALKSLGVTLEDLWDPKTRREFEQLWSDQGKMYKGAHQFSDQMEDIRFQFIRFESILQGFAQTVASKVFEDLGFGSGQLSDQLARLNTYFLDHFPEWSNEISSVLVPALKDLWDIFKDIGEIGKDAWITFQQVIGALSNDDSLSGTAVSIQTIGTTLKHVTEDAHSFLQVMMDLEKTLGHFVLSMVDIGTGHFGAAAEQLKAAVSSVGDSFHHLNPGSGALIGATGGGLAGSGGGAAAGMAVGALAGGGVADMLTIPLGGAIGGFLGGLGGTVAGGVGGAAAGKFFGGDNAPNIPALPESVHDRLRAAADMVAKLTGQHPDLVYGELAHETGNGTNRGFKNLHNLSGIEDGHGKYRSFDSDEDWAQSMARILNRDFAGKVADNPTDYAAILKKGGYFEDSAANYARGIQGFANQYGDVTVNITVPQPNATPAQIAQATHDGVRSALTQRDFTQTALAAGVAQ